MKLPASVTLDRLSNSSWVSHFSEDWVVDTVFKSPERFGLRSVKYVSLKDSLLSKEYISRREFSFCARDEFYSVYFPSASGT